MVTLSPVPDCRLDIAPPVAAGALQPCTAGGRLCVLREETVLIVAADGDAWGGLAAQLEGLGLAVRSCGTVGSAPLQPGEIVSLVLLDGAMGADAAMGQVQAILADRPWVPVLTGLRSGFIVQTGMAGRTAPGATKQAPQPLRRAVVEALCRQARHAPRQPDCTSPPDGAPGHN